MQMYSNGDYELHKMKPSSLLHRCKGRLGVQALVLVIVVQAIVLVYYTQSACSRKLVSRDLAWLKLIMTQRNGVHVTHIFVTVC